MSYPALRGFLLAAALAVLPALPAEGQVIRLFTPNARLAEDFSAIRGVRELVDGRVLVSDYIDQRVVLVDFARNSVTLKVAKGGGPQEARLPTRLIAIPGDSTFVVDLGNNRLLLLDPQGRAVRTMNGERIGILGLRGVDTGGGYYFAIPAWAETGAPLANDSVRIVRWNPREDATTTVAVIQGDRVRSDIRQPAMTPRIPTVGYAPQDAWVVNQAGTLRIVRAGSYRIESIARGARPLVGPSYAYATRPVTPADRLEYVRQFNASSPTSGRGENGGMGYSPALAENEVAAMARGTQYAERHPMFDAGTVVAAADGRLWVGRPVEVGRPVLYDLFDGSGVRVTGVELPPGRRVMAVGRHGVYAVAESEDGLQRLERFPLP